MRLSILILLTSSLTFVFNSNLRNEEDIYNVPSILDNIVPIYKSLIQQMLKEKINMEKELPINIAKDLSTEYFKQIESVSKIKYYLNKELKDFNLILDDILLSMNIPDIFASNIFNSKIPDHPEIFYNGNSISYNLINTASNDNNIISYGSLFITKNENKYNFIFCYGYGDFNRIFNGYNAFKLGQKEYYELDCGASTSSKYFPNSIEENYLMHFMNLIGLKVLGNKYLIDLPYPDFN